MFLGRPALANPHWPVWAARELAHNDPFSLLPQDWSWWLHNRPGPRTPTAGPPLPRRPKSDPPGPCPQEEHEGGTVKADGPT